MPTLKPYTAQLATPETGFQHATPESFGSDIGAGLIHAGRSADALYQNIEAGESRDANVGAAVIRAKYAKLLDEAQINGADTAKLKDDMEGELAKIGENFATRKGQAALEMHTANTNLMFDEQANRIAVVRARDSAMLQVKTLVDKDSDTIRSNPLFLPMAEANADALVATFHMSREQQALQAQRIKEQFNLTAVMASVRIDPEGTAKRLESGNSGWMLTPAQAEQGINAAHAEISRRRTEEQYARQLIEQDRRDRENAAGLRLSTKILNNTIQSGDITNDPDMSMEKQIALTHFQQFVTNDRINGPKRQHPTTMLRLFNMTHDPNDPNYTLNIDPITALTNAATPGLTWQEAQQAVKWVAEQRDENNQTLGAKLSGLVHTQERALSQNLMLQARSIKYPTLIPEILMDYQQRVKDKVSELRAANDTAGFADLFNPASKDYVGSMQFMQPSITSALSKVQRTQPRAAAATETVKFPDGTTRIWNKQEPIKDEANWIPIPASGASGSY